MFTTINLPSVAAVFGFGSFFKDKLSFVDIDLLYVVEDDCDLLYIHRLIKCGLEAVQRKIDLPIHLLMFTCCEFRGAPLRDMATLVTLATEGNICFTDFHALGRNAECGRQLLNYIENTIISASALSDDVGSMRYF